MTDEALLSPSQEDVAAAGGLEMDGALCFDMTGGLR